MTLIPSHTTDDDVGSGGRSLDNCAGPRNEVDPIADPLAETPPRLLVERERHARLVVLRFADPTALTTNSHSHTSRYSTRDQVCETYVRNPLVLLLKKKKKEENE